MAQKKSKLLENALKRHDYDYEKGKSSANDFLQLSKALERAKESDIEIFHIIGYLAKENLDLKKEIKERGSRIAKLQRTK